MTQVKVKAPDGRTITVNVNAPAGATTEQIKEYAVQQAQQNYKPDPYGLTAQKQTGEENALAAFGGELYGLGLGAGQRFGMVDQNTVDRHKRAMENLNRAKGGSTGSIAGQFLPAAATAFIPGANTYTGSAIIGGLYGAAQPTSEEESVAKNTALAAGGGVAGKFVGDKVAQFANNKYNALKNKLSEKAAKNAQIDNTAKETLETGWQLKPSQVGKGSVLESISGKYKTNQALGLKNQEVTDRVARRAIGLDETAELSPEQLQSLRNNAYQRGYKPLEQQGVIKVDEQYLDDLDAIVKDYDIMKKDFPDMNFDDIQKVVDDILSPEFGPKSAMESIKLYRQNAKDAFRKGDTGIARAYKKAADALENQVERSISNSQLLDNFRAARQYIAKTHTIEDALEQSTGRVDATKIGKQLEKGKPLSGDLKKIGKAGSAFKETMKLPQGGDANPLTVFDFLTGTMASGSGAMAFGAPGIMAGAALPLARVGSREYLKRVPPKLPRYDPGLLDIITKGVLDNDAIKALTQGGSMVGLLNSQ